jgi:hypothetical protein
MFTKNGIGTTHELSQFTNTTGELTSQCGNFKNNIARWAHEVV